MNNTERMANQRMDLETYLKRKKQEVVSLKSIVIKPKKGKL
jgi:hypothetical protein